MQDRTLYNTEILHKALETPYGLIITVEGGDDLASPRQTAISSLTALKRTLAQENPAFLNLTIKPVPGSKNEIALHYNKPLDEED